MDQLDDGGVKSPLQSKTINFNLVSGVLVPAVWPFLPAQFRQHDYAAPAVAAWFSLGNIVLRFFSSSAVKLSANKEVSK